MSHAVGIDVKFSRDSVELKRNDRVLLAIVIPSWMLAYCVRKAVMPASCRGWVGVKEMSTLNLKVESV